MSTTPTHAPPSQTTARQEIKIVSHSPLFYWWPVWAVGFILAGYTWMYGELLATVPKDTDLWPDATAEVVYKEPTADPKAPKEIKRKIVEQDILVAPKAEGKHKNNIEAPKLHISTSKNPGVLFAAVLLLVITITNVPMRGLWSVIAIVVILSLVIIFALLGWWKPILDSLHGLDIRITMGGYLSISLVLFVIWLLVFLFFDQQTYMVFTPGQFRVRLEIGEGETAYDTTGMTLQKQRSDLFRHWILGMGSGDLIVRTAGAQTHQFDLHNVLFVGRKVREIEEMLRSRAVVAGRP